MSMTVHMIEKEARRLHYETGLFEMVHYKQDGQYESIPVSARTYNSFEIKEVKEYLKSFDNLIKLTYKPKQNIKAINHIRSYYLADVFSVLIECHFDNQQLAPLIKKTLLKVDQDFLDIVKNSLQNRPDNTVEVKITSFYEEIEIKKIANSKTIETAEKIKTL